MLLHWERGIEGRGGGGVCEQGEITTWRWIFIMSDRGEMDHIHRNFPQGNNKVERVHKLPRWPRQGLNTKQWHTLVLNSFSYTRRPNKGLKVCACAHVPSFAHTQGLEDFYEWSSGSQVCQRALIRATKVEVARFHLYNKSRLETRLRMNESGST